MPPMQSTGLCPSVMGAPRARPGSSSCISGAGGQVGGQMPFYDFSEWTRGMCNDAERQASLQNLASLILQQGGSRYLLAPSTWVKPEDKIHILELLHGVYGAYTTVTNVGSVAHCLQQDPAGAIFNTCSTDAADEANRINAEQAAALESLNCMLNMIKSGDFEFNCPADGTAGGYSQTLAGAQIATMCASNCTISYRPTSFGDEWNEATSGRCCSWQEVPIPGESGFTTCAKCSPPPPPDTEVSLCDASGNPNGCINMTIPQNQSGPCNMQQQLNASSCFGANQVPAGAAISITIDTSRGGQGSDGITACAATQLTGTNPS
ncbi:MAG: hypothetical protein J0L97_08465, partial [Alphaproteobacteria bacterium]|nr:hypothetical protein [Alphaproteobacteria bacterium]